MNTLNNYISEKLFTDIDTQIDNMDITILKKQLSKKLVIPETYIDIKNESIFIKKRCIISFTNKNIKTFIDDIYEWGYKFEFIKSLDLEITESKQINYFENITVQNIGIKPVKQINLNNDWNINFISGSENSVSVINFDKIRFFNCKIKLNNVQNGAMVLNQGGLNNIDVYDNFLQHIDVKGEIGTLSIGILSINSINIIEELTNIINDCKFIKNKNTIPTKGIYFEYNNNGDFGFLASDIIGKPGTKSFRLNPVD